VSGVQDRDFMRDRFNVCFYSLLTATTGQSYL